MAKKWIQIDPKTQRPYDLPPIDLNKPGDYGCDPLGDGTYRMVPSGDIVDADERDRRLGKP